MANLFIKDGQICLEMIRCTCAAQLVPAARDDRNILHRVVYNGRVVLRRLELAVLLFGQHHPRHAQRPAGQIVLLGQDAVQRVAGLLRLLCPFLAVGVGQQTRRVYLSVLWRISIRCRTAD